jgi:hypothetical protein
MNRYVPAILYFLFFVFILARPGAAVTGKDIFELKKAGVSDKTIQVILKEKVIETAAFSVDDIVNMKKAGVTEKTLRILIQEGSFLSISQPIIYGRQTRSIRHISVQDIINLKNNGVSDSIIRSVIEAIKSGDEKDHERAWRILDNMRLRIYAPRDR